MDAFSESLISICKEPVRHVMTEVYHHVRDVTPDPHMVLREFQNTLKNAAQTRSYPESLPFKQRKDLLQLIENTPQAVKCKVSVIDIWFNLCLYTARGTWKKPYAFDSRYQKVASTVIEDAVQAFSKDLWAYVDSDENKEKQDGKKGDDREEIERNNDDTDKEKQDIDAGENNDDTEKEKQDIDADENKEKQDEKGDGREETERDENKENKDEKEGDNREETEQAQDDENDQERKDRAEEEERGQEDEKEGEDQGDPGLTENKPNQNEGQNDTEQHQNEKESRLGVQKEPTKIITLQLSPDIPKVESVQVLKHHEKKKLKSKKNTKAPPDAFY